MYDISELEYGSDGPAADGVSIMRTQVSLYYVEHWRGEECAA